MNWLISAKTSIYNVEGSFEDFGFVDWRQGRAKYEIGDTIFIYCTRPIKSIRYKCRIEKINLSEGEIRDDKEYWYKLADYNDSLGRKFMRLRLIDQVDNDKLDLEYLKQNGLKKAPQGPIKLNDLALLNYINENFNKSSETEIFPDIVSDPAQIYEGAKKQVTVNRYERSSVARRKCIEHFGAICQVCSMNFEAMYGEIGKGFIHVHHRIPIAQIDKEYKINYKDDLIPVCPNCHAMLHQKRNGVEPTVDDLKKMIEERIKNNH